MGQANRIDLDEARQVCTYQEKKYRIVLQSMKTVKAWTICYGILGLVNIGMIAAVCASKKLGISVLLFAIAAISLLGLCADQVVRILDTKKLYLKILTEAEGENQYSELLDEMPDIVKSNFLRYLREHKKIRGLKQSEEVVPSQDGNHC